MGYEVKRVPLDFDWPLKTVWIGFMNPYNRFECPYCGGYGDHIKRLHDTWSVVWNGLRLEIGWQSELVQEEVDALWDAARLQRWTSGPGFDTKPTAEAFNSNVKAKWYSHDTDQINREICVAVRAKRLGLSGTCANCGGDGELFLTPELKRLYNEWEYVQPPTGDGWQVWETVTEGSPISPVFATVDAMVAWLVVERGYSEQGARIFAEWSCATQGGGASNNHAFDVTHADAG